MKPKSVARPRLNTRRSKSLYSHYDMPGKKELEERKGLLKATHSRIQSDLNQNSRIPKPMKSGLKNTRSSHEFQGTSGKNIQTKSKFLRPKIDMLAARKRMFERTLHLKQNSENDVEGKNSDIPDFNTLQKLNLACTPKQSALTKVYLKLTESAKKAAKSRSLFPEAQTPPFRGGEKLHEKINLNSTANADNSFNFENEINSNEPLISCRSTVDKSKGSNVITSESSEEISVDFPDFTVGENRKTAGHQYSGNCALNNILKHCQLYCTKISSIIEAITYLDDSFQRVVVGEIGGHVYSNFCEYQKKKLKLHREMKVIEDELEDAVRNEIDVQTKFQDYLRKKLNIWKEESDLLEEFKNTINSIINKYEEEVVKPPDNNSLHDLVQMFSSSPVSKKDICNHNDKPVLRRSQRLLTPKREQTNDESYRGVRSNNSKNNVRECDDLIIKKNTKSNEKRCIQHSIYKDLQKSFNLNSPECSF